MNTNYHTTTTYGESRDMHRTFNPVNSGPTSPAMALPPSSLSPASAVAPAPTMPRGPSSTLTPTPTPAAYSYSHSSLPYTANTTPPNPSINPTNTSTGFYNNNLPNPSTGYKYNSSYNMGHMGHMGHMKHMGHMEHMGQPSSGTEQVRKHSYYGMDGFAALVSDPRGRKSSWFGLNAAAAGADAAADAADDDSFE